jgi:hypothetical protein
MQMQRSFVSTDRSDVPKIQKEIGEDIKGRRQLEKVYLQSTNKRR